eukprot:Em0021g773a
MARYIYSDDHQILRWDFQSDNANQLVQLPKETYATDIHWIPPGNTAKKQLSPSDLFALACTDDGEDGAIKIWSKTGMLRTILAQTNSDQVLYAGGKTLIIKPLQPSSKPTQWKAHDSLILTLDWSPTNNLIISGGEDRKYKVWDSYGRNVYSSLLHDSPIISLAWAPDGELFAVGAFDTLRLCDKTGGRQLSLIKMAGPNAGPLSDLTVSLTNDTIAIRNQDGKEVHIYDALTGKERTDRTVKHQTEVTSLALSNVGTMAERLLAFMDKNHDLYLTLAHTGSQYSTSPICLGSMVTSICWNSSANMLAAMQDGKFVLWYHPVVVYTDRDLLPQTLLRKERNEFAKNPQLLSFTGNHCSLRRSDGALITTSIPPFPAILHQHASAWQVAACYPPVQDGSLWACLAGMAISSKDLATAEIAYAAINEVHKVQYIQHIRSLSSTDRRSAELALFCHQPQQAEAIYLQSGLTYRAIELNITLFNWERALELAVKYKTHIDTVMAFRQKYLAGIGCQESLKKFVQFTEQLSIDWDKINAKIASEEEKETS